MGEAAEFAGTCQVCGGQIYMVTGFGPDEEIEVYYKCHNCNNIYREI